MQQLEDSAADADSAAAEHQSLEQQLEEELYFNQRIEDELEELAERTDRRPTTEECTYRRDILKNIFRLWLKLRELRGDHPDDRHDVPNARRKKAKKRR